MENFTAFLTVKNAFIVSSGVLCLQLLMKSRIKNTLYAFILDRLAKSLSRSRYFNNIKEEVFLPITNNKSNDIFRIVEIGAGSGSNFKFYPDNVKITCIEPNDSFDSYLLKNCPERLKSKVEFVVASAEDMSKIKSSSVDAVVCTLVFCSIYNQQKAINEVKRILKTVKYFLIFLLFSHILFIQKGCLFYFYEHVKSSKFFEKIFQIIFKHPWWFLCECRTNSDTKTFIQRAGFSSTNIKDCRLPVPYLMFFLKPAIAGTATK